MSAEIPYIQDEWFWRAWSDTLSRRHSRSLGAHYRSHAKVTSLAHASLLSAEFLEQYAALVMLLEQFPAAPRQLAGELFMWRAKSYDEYFRAAGLKDGQFAIAAFTQAPVDVRRSFAQLVRALDAQARHAVEVVQETAKRGRLDEVPGLCRDEAAKLRQMIDEAALVIAGGLASAGEGEGRAETEPVEADAPSSKPRLRLFGSVLAD